MEIKYDITEEDYLNINRDFLINISRMRKRYLIFILVFAPVIILFFIKGNIQIGVIYTIILFATLGVSYLNAVKKTKKLPDQPGIIGEHTLTVSDKGVKEKGSRTVHWDGIKEVKRNDQYVCILFGPSSCYAVPRRAFKDEDEMSGLYSQALEYWVEANRRG
ncbi:MAG: YcxB family protein [Firmicutes bacterium]|nr:YcxB family protein [Bacillota bacterium]